MPIDSSVVLQLTLAIIGASAGLLAYWNNRQTAKKMALIQQNKVDSEAYERARIIFQASIDELEERIDRLKKELNDERAEKETLRVRVDELERIVMSLKWKLQLAGIELS